MSLGRETTFSRQFNALQEWHGSCWEVGYP
jgi:hypothetical protein